MRTNPIFQTRQNKRILRLIAQKKQAIGNEFEQMMSTGSSTGEFYRPVVHRMTRAIKAEKLAATAAKTIVPVRTHSSTIGLSTRTSKTIPNTNELLRNVSGLQVS